MGCVRPASPITERADGVGRQGAPRRNVTSDDRDTDQGQGMSKELCETRGQMGCSGSSSIITFKMIIIALLSLYVGTRGFLFRLEDLNSVKCLRDDRRQDARIRDGLFGCGTSRFLGLLKPSHFRPSQPGAKSEDAARSEPRVVPAWWSPVRTQRYRCW